MRSKILIVVFLILLQTSPSSICETNKCSEEVALQISKAANEADKKSRLSYWYYLRGSDLLFQSYQAKEGKYLFVFIYRNLVGTFLCATSWEKASQKYNLNYLVRIGSGYSRNHNISEEIELKPEIQEIMLQNDEYMLHFNEKGQLKLNKQIESIVKSTGEGKGYSEQTVKIDKEVRKNFWTFLSNSQVIENETISTEKSIYTLLTYLHPFSGTFLALCQRSKTNVVIKGLIRLGATLRGEQRSVLFKPRILALN